MYRDYADYMDNTDNDYAVSAVVEYAVTTDKNDVDGEQAYDAVENALLDITNDFDIYVTKTTAYATGCMSTVKANVVIGVEATSNENAMEVVGDMLDELKLDGNVVYVGGSLTDVTQYENRYMLLKAKITYTH